MNGAAWLLALATLGVDYGWRLDEQGQIEYIIQVSPDQWESLRDSPEGISSAIPPEVVRQVKRFRIVVGNGPLPQDPLPAFSPDAQGLGRITPIGAARVATAGADLPVDEGSGDPGALRSNVTPLDNLNPPRNALPGPGRDLSASDPDDILPLPPIPRASGLLNDGPLALTNIRPTLRRDRAAEDGFTANVSPNTHAPDTSDVWDSSARNVSRAELSGAGSTASRTLPRRELNNTWPGTTSAEKPKNPLLLLFSVCGLCLSVGGNVYLGWIAWGYYMKYRESFESLRGHWTPGS
jgi:hypothetical protein